jgi:uncharacterized protein
LILVNWRRWRDLPAYGRILLFLATLLCLWLPIAAPLYLIWGEKVGTALVVLVYLEFVALIGVWGKYIEQKTKPYAYYGLAWNRESFKEFLAGLAIAVLSFGILYGSQYALGWQTFQTGINWQAAILPGLLTGLGVGFAEELLFRGWLLTELQRDYGFSWGAWYGSLVYAFLHFNFVKPLDVILASAPQFPGLVLLGLNLATARQVGKGKLGLAIAIHGGMVAIYYVISTTKLLQPSGVVPEWITGVGTNPLAGALGIGILGLGILGNIFLLARRRA